jgi:uncharacterized membrane protein YeaQ/YmgE (transglycosylase-associated protein family)
MLNIIFWFIFGVLSGWTVVLIIQPAAAIKRIAASGIVGAIGGIFGGVLLRILEHQPIIDGFDGPSILAAVVTAVLLAYVFNFIFRGNGKT